MIDGPTTRRRLLSSVLLFALVFIVSSSGLILHAGDGFAATATALNGITLTEFMAAPNDALGASAFRDEDGDTVDWIELYNAGAELVNLAGWSLTDNPDRLAKWRFAGETILVPGAYLVVFASGKDRRAANGVLHTNFSLRQEGGFLALVDASGSVASAYSPLYPPQYTGVSYGIDPEPSGPNGYSDRHRYMTEATPGAGNRSPGPAIGLVSHTPNQLLEGSDLNISADVESASALTRVTLHYRANFGAEQELTMAKVGASTYVATVPAAEQKVGTLIRYYITATGVGAASEASTSRWPLPCRRVTLPVPASPPEPFGLWLPTVFGTLRSDDGDFVPCPQYLGTVVEENSPKAVRRLPTLYWYVSENKEYGWEWYRAAYNAHIRSGLPAYTFSDKGTYASIFYDGMLYDNVAVRVRGAGSLAYTKKGLQFVPNPDFEFRLHGDEMGRYTPQGTTFKQFNLTTTGADESYVRQPLAWAAYALTHVPYSVSFPMRIEQNGSFFSVAAFVEQPDSRYLRRQGFDLRGTLFQVYQSSLSLNHINGSSDPTDGVDQIRPKDADRINALHDFIQGINVNPANTLGGRQRITGYLFDHVDIPELINYMATRTAINDWDTTWHNYYLFQDTENGPNLEAQPRRGTDEWRILPWDKDTVLDTTHPGYPRDANHPYFGSHGYAPVPNALYSAVIEDPTLRSMYLRRLRSVMDLLYGTGDTEYWLLEQARQLSADTAKDAQLDSRRWATAGAYKTDVPVASFDPKELPRQIQKRKQELFSGSPNGFAVLIPVHERIRQVYFGSVVSGLLPIESAVTVVNCGQDAADLSGWTLSSSGTPGFVFPAGVVIPAQGRLYLAPDARAFRDSLRRLDKVAALGLFVNGGFDADLLFGKEFPSLRGGVILSDGSQTVASTNSSPAACAAAYLPAIIR